ncbi:MFS transporter [Cryptosporangium minutisporangium]|uniref:MFS transporter n=1 Tax=Cryptosporangium minutisporangium TaxID=113569 RepID=A0ABP6T6L1_9ACTN
MAVDRDVRQAEVTGAVRATYLAFAVSGFIMASWAARIPQVRDRLDLDASRLGLVLLCLAFGSVVALPLAGWVVSRFTSRRTVAAMALLTTVGLLAIAFGQLAGVAPVVVGLFLVGFANGIWDVGMNVQAAVAERLAGRSIMPRFHAGWSAGTVAGALVSTVVVAAGVPVVVHLSVVAVLVGIVVPVGVRAFVPDVDADEEPVAGRAIDAWREPRTLLIGAAVLAFAFAEGAGNDWIGITMIDGYSTSDTIGTLAFATFLAAMTAARWIGPGLLDRYGRVPVVRTLAVVAVVGVLLFVAGPVAPVAFVGVLLWGIGTSLGFPVGMSAGADEPRLAARRVSVIGSIGYCGFLAGPPLIGFFGDHESLRRALISVAVLLAVAGLLATTLRPPKADA